LDRAVLAGQAHFLGVGVLAFRAHLGPGREVELRLLTLRLWLLGWRLLRAARRRCLLPLLCRWCLLPLGRSLLCQCLRCDANRDRRSHASECAVHCCAVETSMRHWALPHSRSQSVASPTMA